MGGWETGTVGGGWDISAVGVVDVGGPAIRLKSLPLGLPVRGDGEGAPPTPLGDATAAVAAATGAGEPTGDGSAVVDTGGGADMRLKSLPFGGGTMLMSVGLRLILIQSAVGG